MNKETNDLIDFYHSRIEDKQTQINANVANHTNTIAVETSELAKNVVESTNTKEFRGK